MNESGKTTLLEAIDAFQLFESETKSLFSSASAKTHPSDIVPKHEKAGFTGETTITAVVEFEPGEKDKLLSQIEAKLGCRYNRNSIPNKFSITHGTKFKDSDRTETINYLNIHCLVKTKGARKEKHAENGTPEWVELARAINKRVPEIVYFPTFIFDQPEKIILNPKGEEDTVNSIYRGIISNVAKSLSNPRDTQTHIVDRITNPESVVEQAMGFFTLTPSKQQQVEAVVDEMSAHLTETIFSRWSRIFTSASASTEIRLKLSVDAHKDGTPRVYVQFGLKDGTTQYDIGERSLGFRWFFSFLLFTLYRTPEDTTRPVLFLLDEPASNLHSGAQMQLLDSFPTVARSGSCLIYSTHSHYMINPNWLDQAFIVSNKGVDYGDVGLSRLSRRPKTDIVAQKYRDFVGQNPDKTTYFQPVLDKLQVTPSRLDIVKPNVLVEGKGDYLILEYVLRVSLKIGADDYSILPTRGADSFHELVGILTAWGTSYVLCLDDDAAGQKARAEFVDNWKVDESKVFTLVELDPALKGARIESLLDDADRETVAASYGIKTSPTKSQIQLFFSEKLATGELVELSEVLLNRVRAFDARVRAGL